MTDEEIGRVARAVWDAAPPGFGVEELAEAVRDALGLPVPAAFPAAFTVTARRAMTFRVTVKRDGTGTVTEVKP